MKNKKGFTLVELLAVIVILGILLLVAVPAVNTIMTNSKKSADRDEAIVFLNALQTCTITDHSGTSVCTPSEALEYMETNSNNVGVRYGTEDSPGSYSRIQNGEIQLSVFRFMGSNGYVVTYRRANESDVAQWTSLSDIKSAIKNAPNAYNDTSRTTTSTKFVVKGGNLKTYSELGGKGRLLIP